MEKLFLQVLDLSIAASWVILAVMAARLLLRKAPKVYSYALWAAVGFRQVSSVSVSSLLSLFNLKSFQKAVRSTGELQFVPRDIGFAEVPQISTGIPAVDTVVNNQLPAAIPEASVNPMQIVIFVGMILWLAGMAVMVAISVINYIRLRKSLRFAVRKEDNIWQCETVRSPFLVGIVKPKIYIPYGLDDQTESYILAHEKYHLKRFDHIVKLVAYALLTVHWFNPLCHLAFRLMNRDMEMSCDEHVLNRNEIPTTQYSLSLLTIATNRRFPAATPLAFAETGVKERMINVLNWKKPKKWVSVVAVIVCAILLISCATNPKVSEPKVDDPTLLEFPGIKWGATMEEVKEALNITEEQISSERTASPNHSEDTGDLIVTDITLFGVEVPIAGFEFRANPGQEVRLFRITVHLAEDADMDKMRETLTEVYGKDVGEYFISYSPYANTEEYKDGTLVRSDWVLREGKKSGDARLWFLANNLGNSSSARPFNQAVMKVINDPEFKTYNWVSSVKGTEIYPTDGVDLIKSRHKDAAGIPEEITQEWIEKEPLVYISLSNRTLAAALAEVEGTTEGEGTLVTHNQLIFDANMLIYFEDLIEFLSGDITPTEPTEAVKPTKSPDLPFLFFPDASWGLEPYQIKEIFELTEDQIIAEGWQDGRYILHIKDIAFFDNEVASVQFSFLTTEVGQHHLAEVTLFYPEETDMAVIKNALTEFYIEPKEGNGFTRYRMTDAGTVESYTDYGVVDPNNPGSSAATGWWESPVTLINAIPDKIQERMITRAILLNKNDESRREVVLEYLDKEPAMYICCTDNGNLSDPDSPYCTKNVVFFSALEYMQISLGYT